MIVHPPVRKSKYFFSKITNEDKKPLLIKLPYASLQQFISLSNQQGYLVHLNLSQEQNALKLIKDLEQQCMDELIANNCKWFHNSLDEDKIKEMFDSTVEHDTLYSYISLLRSHLEIPNFTDIPEWQLSIKNTLPKSYFVTLVCDGLFIYPTRFGLRWIIHSIKEFKEESDDIIPDYEDIIRFWEEQVNTTKKQLVSRLNKIESLMNQIKKKEFSEKEIKELKELL